MDFKYRSFVFMKKRYIYLLIFLVAVLYVLYVYELQKIAFFAENPYAGSLLMFLVFLVASVSYMSITKKISRSLEDILSDRCDPEEYMRIYRYIIHRLRKKGKSQHFLYFLSYSSGLLAAGKYSDALEVLSQIKGFGRSKNSLYGAALYYNYLCGAYIGLGKIDKARDAYKGLEKSCSAGVNLGSNVFISKSYIIKMAQKSFTGAEKFFVKMFEEARSSFERATAKFYLGEVFRNNGDTIRAKEAFEYVISNGNKLHIVEEAKEYIRKIEK